MGRRVAEAGRCARIREEEVLTRDTVGSPASRQYPATFRAHLYRMSEQTAQEFMRVFKRFGSEKQEILVFKPSVLYALAAPST